MGVKITTITALNQVLGPIKSNGFAKLLELMDAGRYMKKFSAFKFIPLMIYANLTNLHL